MPSQQPISDDDGHDDDGSPEIWSNWSGRQTAHPSAIIDAETKQDFVDAVGAAKVNGQTIRAVGASHSHSRVAAPEDLLVRTDGWQGLLSVRPQDDLDGFAVATVRSGSRIFQLGEPLYQAGYGLITQGDIDRQSIAGAIGTGTHGSGPMLGNISTAVTGLRIVLATGDVAACDERDEPELFQVARHSLGAVGLITEVDLLVRDRYQLDEQQWVASPEEVFADIDRLVAATRHFEFFWLPERDICACKSLAELSAAGEPGSGESAAVAQLSKRHRRGWSHRIISSTRDDLHTEMEYAVPAASGPACFLELREMIGRDFPDLAWPLEYRTLAADDLLISVARNRATVTISVHQDITLDDKPLFSACEEVFRRYDGRPHWGKVHYREPGELAALHEGYEKWWEIRDRYDPSGMFVTSDLAALRP